MLLISGCKFSASLLFQERIVLFARVIPLFVISSINALTPSVELLKLTFNKQDIPFKLFPYCIALL